ncbi:MAG: FecR domain-containing protein [Burkholderiales bacterium]
MKLTRRQTMAGTASLLTLAPLAMARAASGEDDGIGGVEDIVNVAWSTVAPNPREEIEFEDAVYLNEVVETDDESALVIKFSDGSKLTLGENSRLVIDQYVYNPGDGDGVQAITLAKGAFRFLSGQLPKNKVKLSTPSVSIGIRGTELIFDVAEDGETELSAISGEAACTDGDGEVLNVMADESIVVGANRRFRGKVRKWCRR